MITVVDYGVGNIKAFVNIYNELGIKCNIGSNYTQFSKTSKIILPGVGHFDFAMKKLKDSGLINILNDKVLDKKIPVLGICVGMQMMASESEEGQEKGLDWIPAIVKKIDAKKLRQRTLLPHMGWNSVKTLQESPLFNKFSTNEDFYFLHSYHMVCRDRQNILSSTNYGEEIATIVQNGNIYGVQCHPEKSHQIGIQFLKNFANL